MVIVVFSNKFQNTSSKIKDKLMKEKIIKQIHKIKINPNIGKPMMYERKGTREIYLKPFRFSYSYSPSDNTITLLNLYHKKKQ
jgi:hypothetical protein